MPIPICVFKPGKETTKEIRELAKLLEIDGNLDRKVVVLSIAGRYRQGKSFLMNFIIRYLRAQGKPNWMDDGAQHEALEGFDWKHTSEPVTHGVLIWPEFFKIRDDSGEELVVILMDTQGVFDTNTSIKDCTSIFSLSVLLSSIQIFNIKQNIHGDDLSHLELFTQFGRLVCTGNSSDTEHSNVRPFQDLIFLVRDWAYPDDFPYGWEGGQGVLNRVLDETGFVVEQATMRANIKNCFESLKCFLMPHPGKMVDTSSKFRGKVSDIDEATVEGIQSFIEMIFQPSNLKPKRIHGEELTVREFMHFVPNYVHELHSDQLATPQTLYNATVTAANSVVVNACFDSYQHRMTVLVTGSPRKPAHFMELHDPVVTEVFTQFDRSPKMGGNIAIASAREDLEARIERAKTNFEIANSSAFEKAELNAKIAELVSVQKELLVRIGKMGEDSEALRRQLERAELERREYQAKAEKAQRDLTKALDQANEGNWFTNALSSVGSFLKSGVEAVGDACKKAYEAGKEVANDLVT